MFRQSADIECNYIAITEGRLTCKHIVSQFKKKHFSRIRISIGDQALGFSVITYVLNAHLMMFSVRVL